MSLFTSILNTIGSGATAYILANRLKPCQNSSPFFAKFYRDYEPAELKAEKIEWLVFMASTYILELDASKDFARMATALPQDELKNRNLQQSILSVAQDETRHAAYLYRAMQRRLPQTEVDDLVDRWRKRIKKNSKLSF